MEATDLKRHKALEHENSELKRMYTNLALDLEAAKYIIKKSSKALPKKRDCIRDGKRYFIWHQQGVSDNRL
jgi:hypothetical protein